MPHVTSMMTFMVAIPGICARCPCPVGPEEWAQLHVTYKAMTATLMIVHSSISARCWTCSFAMAVLHARLLAIW